MIMSRLKKGCNCFSRSWSQRQTQNDLIVITGYDMEKVADLHAVDLQIGESHIVAEDTCTAQ